MDPKKVYVDSKDEAVFLCPQCGESRTANVAAYKNRRGSLKVKCACSFVYEVTLEFRTAYRKPAKLTGSFQRSDPRHGGRMVVKNISMGGLGFETPVKSFLKAGDIITVHFWLDDKRRSEIKKQAMVRTVSGNFVGAEFLNQPGQYDAALGFYMREVIAK
jgi:predicted RNA-binding Zn-ribbon protein involved in translation (DUF1610 family)